MKKDWSNSDRFAVWVLRFIPSVVAAAPERILINGACILIGLSAYLPPVPGSVLATWPKWLALEWGTAMILGAGLTLHGVVRRKIGPERVGMLLVALCAAIFAVDVVLAFHLRGLPTALIFFGIALAKMIRLVLSSASRAHLSHRPPEGDPEDSKGQ